MAISCDSSLMCLVSYLVNCIKYRDRELTVVLFCSLYSVLELLAMCLFLEVLKSVIHHIDVLSGSTSDEQYFQTFWQTSAFTFSQIATLKKTLLAPCLFSNLLIIFHPPKYQGSLYSLGSTWGWASMPETSSRNVFSMVMVEAMIACKEESYE